MSKTVLFAGKDGSLSAFWRFASIVAVFLFVWPPICGIAVWWIKFGSDSMTPLLGWLALIVINAYIVCAPSALLAGIVLAVAAASFHTNSVVVAFVATFGATILIGAIIVRPASFEELADAMKYDYFLFFFASLIATLVCWRLTRRLARTE